MSEQPRRFHPAIGRGPFNTLTRLGRMRMQIALMTLPKIRSNPLQPDGPGVFHFGAGMAFRGRS
jgi:hypothetical protein